jgi:DNA-binding response OmpR family regulator
VDDSRAIRAIVAKKVQEMGFEVGEAGDGEEGLVRLAANRYDLVILDVTMPNLDGPGMLRRMREGGDKTPVLMLTSESKRSIMVDVMKLGIEDYILKPFKPEELTVKIEKIVGPSVPVAPSVPAVLEAPAQLKPPVDVLVIDDMENVHKRLRSVLPSHLSLHGTTSAEGALGMASERSYGVVLLDTEIPDVKTAALLQQLRQLQPHAALLALSLRGASDKPTEPQGFDGCVHKPFTPQAIEELVARFFARDNEVRLADNLVTIAGSQGTIERYYRRLAMLVPPALDKVSAAGHAELILDLTQAVLHAERMPRLIVEIVRQAKLKGLGVHVVGTPELQALLRQSAETAGIACHGSLAEARAAA